MGQLQYNTLSQRLAHNAVEDLLHAPWIVLVRDGRQMALLNESRPSPRNWLPAWN